MRLTLLAGVLAAMIATPVLAGHAGPPTTTHDVQPERVTGNVNCGTLFPGTTELRIEPVADGTYTTNGFSVTIDVYNSPDGQAFDFHDVEGGVVLGVAVKGGSDTNKYDYRPDGVTEDTFLHAPVNHNNNRFFGLSHISFCFGEEEEPQDPDSELHKAVRNVSTEGEFGGSAEASPGDRLEYRLTYHNHGDADATNVVVTDELDEREAFVSCTGGCATGDDDGDGNLEVTWELGTQAPGAEVELFYRVDLDESMDDGTVRNVATVDSDEEDPEGSNETTVTVTRPRAPDSELHKAVRNVSTEGEFGGSAQASSGDRLEYRLTYHNHGDADATNVVVTDELDEREAFVSCTGGCATGDDDGDGNLEVTWELGTQAPGAEVELFYRVDLDESFPAGQTTVSNVATVDSDEEDPEDSNETTVTVTAAPDLVLDKSADEDSVPEGGLATFSLSFENVGNAPATGVVITDTLPEGTQFESCTDDCTVDGDQVSWSIGTVNPGDSGEVSLTVRIESVVPLACVICNDATITGDEADENPEDNDAQACITVEPQPDPEGANASGSAFGAHVREEALLGLGINETFVPVSSSQSGVGSDGAEDQMVDLKVGANNGSTLRAAALATTSTSTITEEPAEARSTSTAVTTEVDVMEGLVTADVVRAVAEATATGTSASFSSQGSTFENLVVDGQQINDVAPNTEIALDETEFGSGSKVVLYERVGDTTTPADDQFQGGTYAADLEVNMIRVHVTGVGVLGLEEAEVVVSNAVAHADFPQTTLCEAEDIQAVSGHAFNLNALTDPSLLPTTVGFVSIPPTGGEDSQQLNDADAAGAATASTSESESTGTLGDGVSTASSFAQTQSACVLPDGGSCLISADVARAQSNSEADAGGASANASGTELVGLVVAGQAIEETPEPNTIINIPLVGFVVLNEQFCDNNGTLENGCADGDVDGHAGLTVRAIRLVILDPLSGGLPGAQVIVSEAHSDARFLQR